jgi:hypothetical protein
MYAEASGVLDKRWRNQPNNKIIEPIAARAPSNALGP